MSNKQRRNRKKNQQVQALNKAIRNNTGVIENTTVQGGSSLSGSDESGTSFDEYNKNEKKEEINSKPYRYVVEDFIKEKGTSSLIVGSLVTAVFAVAGWSLSKTVEMDKNIAEHEIRLNRLEKDIEVLKEKTPNKELIEYELKNLKGIGKDIDGFDKRLTRLEHFVSEVK